MSAAAYDLATTAHRARLAALAARLAETARREPTAVLGVLALWLPKHSVPSGPPRHV